MSGDRVDRPMFPQSSEREEREGNVGLREELFVS